MRFILVIILLSLLACNKKKTEIKDNTDNPKQRFRPAYNKIVLEKMEQIDKGSPSPQIEQLSDAIYLSKTKAEEKIKPEAKKEIMPDIPKPTKIDTPINEPIKSESPTNQTSNVPIAIEPLVISGKNQAKSTPVLNTQEISNQMTPAEGTITDVTPIKPIARTNKTPFSNEQINNNFAVQLGSFGTQEAASKVLRKTKAFNLSAKPTIQPAIVNGRSVYRVISGPFESKQAAQAELSKVIEKGHYDAFVTKIS